MGQQVVNLRLCGSELVTAVLDTLVGLHTETSVLNIGRQKRPKFRTLKTAEFGTLQFWTWCEHWCYVPKEHKCAVCQAPPVVGIVTYRAYSG
jgi:hypothetical protein